MWLLRETYEPQLLTEASCFDAADTVVEVGPRMSFASAFSSNAVSIARNCGVPVARMERFRRYRLRGGDTEASGGALSHLATIAHDRMTECVVAVPPLTSFGEPAAPEPVRTVPLLTGGRAALEAANKSLGLGMDAW